MIFGAVLAMGGCLGARIEDQYKLDGVARTEDNSPVDRPLHRVDYPITRSLLATPVGQNMSAPLRPISAPERGWPSGESHSHDAVYEFKFVISDSVHAMRTNDPQRRDFFGFIKEYAVRPTNLLCFFRIEPMGSELFFYVRAVNVQQPQHRAASYERYRTDKPRRKRKTVIVQTSASTAQLNTPHTAQEQASSRSPPVPEIELHRHFTEPSAAYEIAGSSEFIELQPTEGMPGTSDFPMLTGLLRQSGVCFESPVFCDDILGGCGAEEPPNRSK
ncbi:hypothetical protein PAPHI01_1100 [Pancytospora philotis]|nr:hypothetical protein PAPHI01_1100 [Pancytospora philotis]